MARVAISKSLRFEIFKRDGFRCRYCGAAPGVSRLHLDHVVPVVNGGTNRADNLVAACSDCNLGKATRSVGPVPSTADDISTAWDEGWDFARADVFKRVIESAIRPCNEHLLIDDIDGLAHRTILDTLQDAEAWFLLRAIERLGGVAFLGEDAVISALRAALAADAFADREACVFTKISTWPEYREAV